MNSALSAF